MFWEEASFFLWLLALSYKKYVVLSSALFRLKQFGGSQLSIAAELYRVGFSFFISLHWLARYNVTQSPNFGAPTNGWQRRLAPDDAWGFERPCCIAGIKNIQPFEPLRPSKHWLIIFQLYVLLHPAMLCVALVVANSTLCCQTQIQAFRMPMVVWRATFFFCRSIIMTAVTYFVYDRDNIHKKKLASAEKALD